MTVHCRRKEEKCISGHLNGVFGESFVSCNRLAEKAAKLYVGVYILSR